MALYLPDRNALFLHIPKTGGFWVEEAMKRVGLATQLIPSPQDWTRADRHCLLADFDGKPDFVFAFVRHPLRWYESWWRYQAGKHHNWDRWRWHPTYPLQSCRASDFNQFIANVEQQAPGFLRRFYEQYVGPPEAPIHFIGRVERIVDDFLRAMAAIDWPVDRRVLGRIPRQNVSSSPLGQPVWLPERERAILDLERPIFERFYPDELESLLAN